MKNIYKLLFVAVNILFLGIANTQGQSNTFTLQQSINPAGDSLYLELLYSNDRSNLDTLGSANFRINYDTLNLDPSGVTIKVRGMYDGNNHAGYKPMTVSIVADTFFSLNVFNDHTTGYLPVYPLVNELVAVIAIPIKNQCGTSGISWRLLPAEFPGTTVNHYSGSQLFGQNFSGSAPNFLLNSVSDTVRSSFDSLCYGVEDTVFLSVRNKDGYAFYSDIDGFIDTIDVGTQPENYVVSSTLSVGTHKIWARAYQCGGYIGNTDSVEVVINPQPTGSIGAAQDSICVPTALEMYQLAGAITPGSAYTWYITQGNGTFNGGNTSTTVFIDWNTVGAGSDTVILEEVNSEGCTIFDTLPIFLFSNPIPSLGNDTVVCTGTHTLDAGIVGASSYQWYSLPGPTVFLGETNQTYTATTAGTYMVRVDSAGNLGNSCYQYDTINVDIYSLTDQVIDPDSIYLCDSGNVTINLTASQVGVEYYLRDDSDSTYVDGPFTGTGLGVALEAGLVTKPTTYNVIAHSGPGSAITFDGGASNEYVDCGNDASLNISGSLTVEAWIKSNAVTPNGSIVFNGGAFVNPGFALLFHSSGVLRAELDGNIVDNTYSNPLLWHHVAFTWEASTGDVTVYIDGAPQANTGNYAGPLGVYTGSMSIGGLATGSYFDGAIDEVRIWNRALSPAEIDSTWDACLNGTEPGLVAYYDMEENGGNTIYDRTGNPGNTGTFVNMEIPDDWVAGSGVCGTCQLEMSQLAEAIVIKNPKPDLGNDTTGCGGSITLDAGYPTAANYQWYTLPGPSALLGQTSQTYTAAAAGTYMVRMDSTGTVASPCYQYDTVNVDIVTLTNQTIDPDTFSLCKGDTIDVQVPLLGSDVSVYYFLRDEVDSSYVSGPVLGTGGPVGLDWTILSDSTVNVLATTQSYSLDFDGSNDQLTANVATTLTSGITMEAWFRSNNPSSGSNQIIMFNGAYGSNGVGFFIAPLGRLSLRANGSFIQTDSTIVAGEWYHVAITASGGVIQVYINGEDQNFNWAQPFSSATGNFTVGHTGAGNVFDGLIDEVRVWERVLTEDEIRQLMHVPLDGSEANLVTYFNMENGSGTTVTDLSPNANHGTMLNMDPIASWGKESPVGGACELEMAQLVYALESLNPKPDLGPDDTICHDFVGLGSYYEVSNVTAGPLGSYEWYRNGFQQFVNNDSLEFFGSSGGAIDTVVLELDSAGNGCFQYDTVHVRILDSTTASTLFVSGFNSGNDTICNGEQTSFMKLGGFHSFYSWYYNGSLVLSGGADNFWDTNMVYGDEVVVISSGANDMGYCPDIANDTIQYYMPLPLAANLFFTGDSAICSGDSVELKATSSSDYADYEWVRDGISVLGPGFNDTLNTWGDIGSYYVAVTDTFGCADTSITKQITSKPGLKVDLTVLLEGPYNGTRMEAGLFTTSDTGIYSGFSLLQSQFEHPLTRGGGPAFGGAYGINMAAGDTVPALGGDTAIDVIALSYRSTPFGPDLDTSYAWLMSDGSLRDFYQTDSTFGQVCGLPPANYHVVVRHRNHITIMSNSVPLNDVGVPANYNLSNVANVYSAAYGIGVVDYSGVGTGPAVMIGGNADPYQQIDASDLNLILQDNNILSPGYRLSDFNLSGNADATDLFKVDYNNTFLFYSVTPNP